VVLVCGSHEVLLAHFQRGSLSVRVGQQVEVADPIARIGNTGNSSEPHLHLSVQRPDARAAWLGGRPVHVTFRGRVITRNACLPTG
jgi:murein DD-endopeptidase MepM/ murein hydrolase activator NlpD